MKIAITGATGQLGQLVIQQLLQRTQSQNIVALVRDPVKAHALFDADIEVRLFDYNQPETLAPALEGIDKLLLISSSEIGRRTAQHQVVIQAAQSAHVPYIAYTSLLHADTSPLGLAQEHRDTEQLIQQSGLSYTLLRNNWYSENYLAGLTQAIESGVLYGAAKDAKMSSATRQDYAEAAAVVLTTEGHHNRIYELAATQSYTLVELAQYISEASGRTVVYQNLSDEVYRQALIGAGLDQGLVEVIVDADLQAQQGALYSERKDLSELLGRATTPIQTAIQQQLTQH